MVGLIFTLFLNGVSTETQETIYEIRDKILIINKLVKIFLSLINDWLKFDNRRKR